MTSIVENKARRTLQEIVAPGRLNELLGQAAETVEWLPARPTRTVLDRVGGEPGNFVLQGRVFGPGSAVTLIIEVIDGDVVRYADETNGRLRKPSLRQWSAQRDGVVALPGAGFVIRPAGLDHRIPGLRLLHSRQQAQALLSPIIGEVQRRGRLLSHRFGKRAVIEFRGAGRRCVVKAYKARSSAPGLIDTVVADLGRDPRFPLAQLLGTVPGSGLHIWEHVGKMNGDEYGPPPDSSVIDLMMTALTRLHAAAPQGGIARHGPAQEIEILTSAAELSRIVAPAHSDLISMATHRVRRVLAELSSAPTKLIHRDMHRAQFAITKSGCRLLDLDTLSLGDPALDVANLSAHLDAGGSRDSLELLLESYGPNADLTERAQAWWWASTARIGLMWLRIPERARAGRVLLERVVS